MDKTNIALGIQRAGSIICFFWCLILILNFLSFIFYSQMFEIGVLVTAVGSIFVGIATILGIFGFCYANKCLLISV